MTALAPPLEFRLPDELIAHEPPEARGLARDEVRLLVSRVGTDEIGHARFHDLSDHLAPGDVIVVNESATINAALRGVRESLDGSAREVVLHLSAPLSATRWVVELRRRLENGTAPLPDAAPGETVTLPGCGSARLIEPYAPDGVPSPRGTRLWIADLSVGADVLAYTRRFGAPIRYSYVPRPWPLRYYQTVFAREPGSAEMPSAGRAFTRALAERLRWEGIRIAPLVLHTGVSSLESDEPPYPERFRVPPATARVVNEARARGSRVVAVGTTVVRALESAAGDDAVVRAAGGWTKLVITPERGVSVVDAMITGFHPPEATHLAMLEAFAGRDHLSAAYASALRERYLWHEFGDLHLLVR